MANHIIVHYGDLRLKGRNRNKFEDLLINNIKKICGGEVEKLSSSLLCHNTELDKLKYISGISWYAECTVLQKNYDELLNYFNKLDKSILQDKKSFAVRIKRSDKKFEYDTNQLAQKIGELIRTEYNLEVDLSNPDITFYIEISEYILIYYSKIKGLFGFPAGIHGKVLCLLSGGIDSPVAAFNIIKKGCHVDLIHFHGYTDNKKVIDSKIFKIAKILDQYQLNTKIYIVPSYIFDFSIIKKKTILGYEMILFRIFMHKLSQTIASNNNYKALVNGDSLGQVASQTIENIATVQKDLDIQVLQPLISLDKQEIINQAMEIETYAASIEKYKDCCSIISKNPVTKATYEKVQKLEQLINLDQIIDETMSNIYVYSFNTN
jgi:thiamine biosynthesis protein ThiI